MLAGNIIPIGGTSIMAGFNDRLQRQLSGSVSSVRVTVGNELKEMGLSFFVWLPVLYLGFHSYVCCGVYV